MTEAPVHLLQFIQAFCVKCDNLKQLSEKYAKERHKHILRALLSYLHFITYMFLLEHLSNK